MGQGKGGARGAFLSNSTLTTQLDTKMKENGEFRWPRQGRLKGKGDDLLLHTLFDALDSIGRLDIDLGLLARQKLDNDLHGGGME